MGSATTVLHPCAPDVAEEASPNGLTLMIVQLRCAKRAHKGQRRMKLSDEICRLDSTVPGEGIPMRKPR